MRRPTLGVLVILLGFAVGGCSLAEVYPTVAGPTGGPSPYGAWYEQHWQTNAILLADARGQKIGRYQMAVEEKSELDGPPVHSVVLEEKTEEPAKEVSETSEEGPHHPCTHRWWPCFGSSSSSAPEPESVETDDSEMAEKLGYPTTPAQETEPEPVSNGAEEPTDSHGKVRY